MTYDKASQIRIGIVENDLLYRQALSSLFTLSPEFQLIGSWKDAESAIREIPWNLPHVVLIDIHLLNATDTAGSGRMAGAGGIDCIRRLRKLYSGIQLLAFSGNEQEEQPVFEAFMVGASGYLLKSDGPELLIRSIKELYAGGVPMSRSIARKLINSLSKPASAGDHSELLTKREEEVMALLAEGKMYKETALRLGITMETTKKHVQHIYGKLKAQNRMEAVNKWRATAGEKGVLFN
jgi:two-component system, NarL family, response regulator LiaR